MPMKEVSQPTGIEFSQLKVETIGHLLCPFGNKVRRTDHQNMVGFLTSLELSQINPASIVLPSPTSSAIRSRALPVSRSLRTGLN